MLSERFSGTAFTLGDVKKFIERAEVLGHKDNTKVGVPGVGLELFIDESGMPSALYCSEKGCQAVFTSDELLHHCGTNLWVIPSHTGSSRFNCNGAGRPGVKER